MLVILVESDDDIAESIEEILSYENYTVARYKSCSEALKAIKGVKPNVVVLDYSRRDATCEHVARMMREYGNITIVMTTILNKDEEIMRTMHPAYIIHKPFDVETFYSDIRSACRAKAAASAFSIS